ncbi:hypothetical protein MTBUT4_190006 [Magnetospirillum sp. UT-4]|nr:hypothetical protein MTBUT4_190006 [Magnetospirillum sp. UT-4]
MQGSPSFVVSSIWVRAIPEKATHVV